MEALPQQDEKKKKKKVKVMQAASPVLPRISILLSTKDRLLRLDLKSSLKSQSLYLQHT